MVVVVVCVIISIICLCGFIFIFYKLFFPSVFKHVDIFAYTRHIYIITKLIDYIMMLKKRTKQE